VEGRLDDARGPSNCWRNCHTTRKGNRHATNVGDPCSAVGFAPDYVGCAATLSAAARMFDRLSGPALRGGMGLIDRRETGHDAQAFDSRELRPAAVGPTAGDLKLNLNPELTRVERQRR
jgi:hypothetical protein